MNAKKLVLIIATSLLIFILIWVEGIIPIRMRSHFAGSQLKIQTPISISPSPSQETISTTNVNNLLELDTILPLEDGAIIGLSENSNQGNLQIVYSNGYFAKWSLAGRKSLGSVRLFTVESPDGNVKSLRTFGLLNGAVSFNGDGSLLVTPEIITDAGLNKLTLWETADARKVFQDLHTESRQYLIHPNLDVELYLSDTRIGGAYGFINKKDAGLGELPLPVVDMFSRMAIDPAGDYLAAADATGKIFIFDISAMKRYGPNDGFYSSHHAFYGRVGFFTSNTNTIDLKFDPTHSWLAQLTDKNIIVWSLQNYVFPLYLSLDMAGGNVLCFDRTGTMLAVATTKGIQIFDLEKKEVVASYDVGEVTALYFSRSNHLLIWGDAQGMVHLWGVK